MAIVLETPRLTLRHQDAFAQLHLARLICLIDPENGASKKVAEKIGMTLEKKVDGINGDGMPTLIYSVTRRLSLAAELRDSERLGPVTVTRKLVIQRSRPAPPFRGRCACPPPG